MSRDLEDTNYYISQGGIVPVKWTAPEVGKYYMIIIHYYHNYMDMFSTYLSADPDCNDLMLISNCIHKLCIGLGLIVY